MKRYIQLGAWIAGGAGIAMAATGAVLLVGAGRPVSAGSGPAQAAQVCPTPSAAQIQAAQQQYAQRLAQALGKPEQEVEQALQQVPPPTIGLKGTQISIGYVHVQAGGTPTAGAVATTGTLVVGFGGDPSILAPAAAKLGVTPQRLADAFKAAGDQLKPAEAPSCSRPVENAVIVTQGGDGDLFAAVAQQLGNGITAEQVRDAMQLVQPPAPPAPDGQLKAKMDQYVQSLAAALHVSVDQLQAAMQAVGDCRALSSDGPATPATGVAMCFSIAGQSVPPPTP